MTHSIDQVVWSMKSLGDALLTLAKYAKLPHQTVRLSMPAERRGECEAGHISYERWLEAAAERIGLEVESVVAPYSDVESMLGHAGPALIAIPAADLQFVVVLGYPVEQARRPGARCWQSAWQTSRLAAAGSCVLQVAAMCVGDIG